jgi:hypothetical protein
VKNVVINKQRDVTPFFILQNLATLPLTNILVSSANNMGIALSFTILGKSLI